MKIINSVIGGFALKAKWIFPLVVCILLLLALVFRWEQGPKQTEKDLQIIHLKDRWTGQAWIKTYGTKAGKLYSGEMDPVPEINKVETRKTEIINSEEFNLKKEELEKQAEFYSLEMSQHEQGNKQYMDLVKDKILSDWPNQNSWMINYYTNYAITDGRYNSEIPKEIVEHRKSWGTAKFILGLTNKEISDMDLEAETQAESELKTWSWQERKIATYTWIGLFIIMISLSLFLLKKKDKTN